MAKTLMIFAALLAAAVITQASPLPQEEDLTCKQSDEIFAKIDLDKSGDLSKKEFRKMIKAVNKGQDGEKLKNKDINELFDSLDTNQDNVLDNGEFCGYDGQKRNFIINGGLQGNTIYNWVVVNNYYGCQTCG